MQVSLFDKEIADVFRVNVFADIDDNPQPFAVGLVADIENAVDIFPRADIVHPFHEGRFVDVKGNLGNDELVLVFPGNDFRFRLDNDPAATGLIRLFDPVDSLDDSAGREIGTLDDFHQFV